MHSLLSCAAHLRKMDKNFEEGRQRADLEKAHFKCEIPAQNHDEDKSEITPKIMVYDRKKIKKGLEHGKIMND